MIKTLVSIHLDLASSLAIRFACQLANHLKLDIHPVYVKGVDAQEPPIGAGWARRTWEREVLDRGREEITEMISSEMGYCPVIQQPKVIFGDREVELLKLMELEPFDLYIEGVFYTWKSSEIHRRIRSRLFQRVSCPKVIVRALKPLGGLALMCTSPEETLALAEVAKGLWSKSDLPVWLIPFSTEETEKGLLDVALNKAKQSLESTGCQVNQQTIAGKWVPQEGQQGLVAIAVPRTVKRSSHHIQLIEELTGAVLIALH